MLHEVMRYRIEQGIVSLFLCFFVFLPANAYTSLEKPKGFVTQFFGLLSRGVHEQIEADLRAFEQKTGHEIAVVIIPSLDGDYIENYAEKLFKEWGIGKKGADNGVLLLIAYADKKMRIEVGYGLEGAFTDAEASQIIRNVLRPAFQSGDYDGGVQQAVREIERAIQEEVPIQSSLRSSKISSGVIEFFIWAGIVFFLWGGAILERTKSWWLGGIVGAIVGFIVGAILLGFVLKLLWWIIGVALAGLGFDYLVSKNYQKRKAMGRTASWWAGGGWGPGGGGGWGGGGGFGGFGGGGSGGGGSSGGW